MLHYFAQRLCMGGIIVLISYSTQFGTAKAADYVVGADLSFLKQAEDRGTVFKDDGQVKPGLQIFKDHGYNWIRLRLFHTPTQLPNNLEYTIALAKEAKKLGLKFSSIITIPTPGPIRRNSSSPRPGKTNRTPNWYVRSRNIQKPRSPHFAKQT